MHLTITFLAASVATAATAAPLSPKDPASWRGAAAAEFACFVDKELGGGDPAFPCGGKALVEGCRVGPRINGLQAHRIHPLVRAATLEWRRGKLQSVTLWLKSLYTPKSKAALEHELGFKPAPGLAYEDCGMEMCISLVAPDGGTPCGSEDLEPPELPRESHGRLRAHFDGALGEEDPRSWIGPHVPAYVPRKDGSSELTILDETKDGHFALYRDMYAEQRCKVMDSTNCRYVAAFWKGDGTQAWRVELTPLLSEKRHIEIQDAQYVDGTLYFNEACLTYAKEAKGKCSALVAYDPVKGREVWRTKPLHSNSRFLVLADVIVATYGFTSEADFVRVVRRRDGKVLDQAKLKEMGEAVKQENDGTIAVVLDGGFVARFRLKDGKLAAM